MKEYLNKFNKFRKDPKKKSISLLIIYGIFFIFVFIYISGNKPINSPNDIDTNNQNQNDNINDVTSYEYTYEIIQNDLNFKGKGIYYNNKNKIEIDGNFIKENNYQISFAILYDNKLNYNNLDNFLKNYDYESKTEYKDGNIKYEYIINNNDMIKYLNIELNEGYTNISVIRNDYINEVNINLSNNYSIKINYNNINNINSVDTK